MKKLKFTNTRIINKSSLEEELTFPHNVKVISMENMQIKFHNNKLSFPVKIVFTKYSDISYNELVRKLIRVKYDCIDDEIAIIRQKETKPSEFNEYDSYVEDCKRIAKEFVNERDE